ncbi:MAG TPA: DUF3617 domain-containing protein [Sphingomicrobium sp.]|jgi:hypothetical protein|nr:DUF3617 domain-containing protein [Sphingomicrobium sp.]
MRYSLVVLSLAALAACNKGPEINVKNASVGEVAEKVREAGSDGSFVDPGRWETKVSLLDIEVPGMPPQMAQQMKQTMGKLQDNTYATCLTDADVKKPKEDFFAGKNRNCRYDHFTMSGGKIDAALSCPGRGSEGMAMTITGSYSRDSYEATMAMDVSGGPRGQSMKMRSHSESHRVGACKGDELNANREKQS